MTKGKERASKRPVSESSSDSDSETISQDEISVDFEFYNMDTDDYHSVRNFLIHALGRNYSKVIEAGEIANFITETLSEDVGTTIKTEGEKSDPYGFVSIAPLREAKSKPEAMLKAFFLKTAEGTEKKAQLEAFFKAGKTGVVFMERFVNLPADIAGPVYKQLLEDYKHASKEDPTFKIERVLLSTPTFVEVESELDKELAGKKANKKKAKTSESNPADSSYYYGEAEMLLELAEFSWDFKVESSERPSDSKRAFGDMGVIAGRRVFALTMANFTKFVNSIEEYIKA
jgi:hypothetical protein